MFEENVFVKQKNDLRLPTAFKYLIDVLMIIIAFIILIFVSLEKWDYLVVTIISALATTLRLFLNKSDRCYKTVFVRFLDIFLIALVVLFFSDTFINVMNSNLDKAVDDNFSVIDIASENTGILYNTNYKDRRDGLIKEKRVFSETVVLEESEDIDSTDEKTIKINITSCRFKLPGLSNIYFKYLATQYKNTSIAKDYFVEESSLDKNIIFDTKKSTHMILCHNNIVYDIEYMGAKLYEDIINHYEKTLNP